MPLSRNITINLHFEGGNGNGFPLYKIARTLQIKEAKKPETGRFMYKRFPPFAELQLSYLHVAET